MKMVKALLVLAGLVVCSALIQGAEPPGLIRTTGMGFVDANGKALILHGINVENKDPKQGYLGDFGTSDLDLIRSWGMNCIRLTIFWDGLEPEPGKIDRSYIKRIANLVDLAKRRGIYVLLDMHQDLYSVKFSDGAPAWATLDEGKPFTASRVWSDAYVTSEAVQTAFDHFWANAPASDGEGLQDHYARVWQAVATRFAREPAVVGYDLMNEPAPGVDYARAQQAGITALAQALEKRDGAKAPGVDEIVASMSRSDGLKRLQSWLADPLMFSAMLEGMAPVSQNFERTQLMPFYTRVARAIRQVDHDHVLFLEPVILSGVGVRSALAPVTGMQGKPEPQLAFSPHCYDITTDNGPADPSGNSRLRIILSNHSDKSRELDWPMLVGEWGAFYLDGGAAASARFITSEFDRLESSDTYWSYQRALAHSALLPALSRGIH